MEELDDMFIKGQYTPFSDQPSNKKHPLTDSTNAKQPRKEKFNKPPVSDIHNVLMHELYMYMY